MKANVLKSGLKAAAGMRALQVRWLFFLSMTALFLSSCNDEPWYGRNGQPGYAFLSITWIDVQPDYIDAGTGDIPPVFQYGRYYNAWPGFYTMYYDGRFWNGQSNVFYAWEVDYEIWETPGEPGSAYYNGVDGQDNYFTIECSPFGPWVYGPGYKSAELPDGYELKESSDDEIVITKEAVNFGISLTYRKVVPRERIP